MKSRFSAAVLWTVFVFFAVRGMARAAAWEVSTETDFSNALVVAQTNLQDDIITISGGFGLTAEIHFDSSEPYYLDIVGENGNAILDAELGGRILYVWQRSNSGNAWFRASGIRFLNGIVNGDFGGGVFVRTQQGNIAFTNCEFRNCRSTALYVSSQAGGVFARIENTGSFSFEKCTFIANIARGYGGGAYLMGGSGSDLIMRNCAFTNNDGSTAGGGLAADMLDCAVLLENNTFFRNKTGAGFGGGGAYISVFGDASTVDLRNNIAWSNTADNALGSDIYIQDDDDGNAVGAVLSIVRNNYKDLESAVGDHLTLLSNVTTDPRLRSDLTLMGTSPCIDAGTNADWMAGATDLAGKPRIINGVVDMGARECVFTNRQPTITWGPVAGATKYELSVYRNGTKYYSGWLGTNPVSWTFSMVLPGGDYAWWVRPWSNAVAIGSWSAEKSFVVLTALPGQPVPQSPAGVTATNRPEFIWLAADRGGATSYKLQLNKSGVSYLTKWTGGATNYTFASSLPMGVYDWWVRGWNPDGYGAWSSSTSFTYGVTVALSPTGTVTGTRRPGFYWTEVPGATRYYVRLYMGSGTYSQLCVRAATTTVFAVNLRGTNYLWRVRPWNSLGYGPWSAMASFQIPFAAPATGVPLSPSGTAVGRVVPYTWQGDTNATKHELLIYRNNVKWFDKWYYPATPTGDLSNNVSTHTAGAVYKWWVRGKGPDGYGAWSPAMVFTNQ